MKFKRHMAHDIVIRPTTNDGFIVEIGCARVAYSNYGSLLQDLKEYLEDPEGIEKQYSHDIAALDRVHLGPIVPSVYGIIQRKQPPEQQYKESEL